MYHQLGSIEGSVMQVQSREIRAKARAVSSRRRSFELCSRDNMVFMEGENTMANEGFFF